MWQRSLWWSWQQLLSFGFGFSCWMLFVLTLRTSLSQHFQSQSFFLFISSRGFCVCVCFFPLLQATGSDWICIQNYRNQQPPVTRILCVLRGGVGGLRRANSIVGVSEKQDSSLCCQHVKWQCRRALGHRVRGEQESSPRRDHLSQKHLKYSFSSIIFLMGRIYHTCNLLYLEQRLCIYSIYFLFYTIW